MEQYRYNPANKGPTRAQQLDLRDPLLESAVQRVNQLSGIVEAQQRQLSRLEAQIAELQRFIVSTKR